MRSSSKWALVALAIVALLGGAFSASAFAARPNASAAPAQAGRTLTNPVVIQETKHDTSIPLREMKPIPPAPGINRLREHDLNKGRANGSLNGPDAVLQTTLGPLAMPTPIRTFDGIANQWSVYPPDPNGDVGPNHIIETVNNGFRIWDKSGNPLTAVMDTNTVWSGFGGPCQTLNDGDPIVLYDQLANRWLISQFAIPTTYSTYECIAISQTADPTGAWHRYAFLTSATLLEDYPHIGVWPDGYYMTTNEFDNTNNWAGTGQFAFDRTRMLQGLSATGQYFHLGLAQWGGMLPSDLDGMTMPPAGAPNTFLEIDDAAWDPTNIPQDQIEFWQFHVDWITPANSTFTNSANVAVAPFDGIACPNFARNCIPQQGTAVKLDAITDRGMYRVAYRNLGSHESIVFNHTVDASGLDNGMTGVRWYEIRSPRATTPTIFQQSTYAPADGKSRWMGSAAMDSQGNMAVGFSISSSSLFPSIAYAGRLATDPPNQLTQGEATMFAGTGSQTGPANRWGDYSMLTVDPTDDCTFWYTNEYYATTSAVGWRTRIGSFKFPNCGQGAATPTVVPPSPTRTPGTPTPTVTPGGPTPCAITFIDVDQNNPFYSFIRCLACRQIVSGYADGTFRWGNNVTRGQVSKMVANAANFTDAIPSTQQTFQDTLPTSAFWLWIERLSTRGYISGYTCGGAGEPCVPPGNRPYFRPNADITRGQLAKVDVLAKGYNDVIATTTQTFQDVPSSNPFWLFIERASLHSVISGYTCGGAGEPCVPPGNRPYFRWGASATRGQTSKVVANTFYPGCVTPQSLSR